MQTDVGPSGQESEWKDDEDKYLSFGVHINKISPFQMTIFTDK